MSCMHGWDAWLVTSAASLLAVRSQKRQRILRYCDATWMVWQINTGSSVYWLAQAAVYYN